MTSVGVHSAQRRAVCRRNVQGDILPSDTKASDVGTPLCSGHFSVCYRGSTVLHYSTLILVHIYSIIHFLPFYPNPIPLQFYPIYSAYPTHILLLILLLYFALFIMNCWSTMVTLNTILYIHYSHSSILYTAHSTPSPT